MEIINVAKIKAELIEKIKEMPIHEPIEIEPTEVVFELNTERDDIELLGRVTIISVLPNGVLVDEEGEWNIEDDYQPIYSIDSLVAIYNAISKKIY